jgi:hypothetical protein
MLLMLLLLSLLLDDLPVRPLCFDCPDLRCLRLRYGTRSLLLVRPLSGLLGAKCVTVYVVARPLLLFPHEPCSLLAV